VSPVIRPIGPWLARAALLVVAAPLAYLLAAFLLGVVPVNRDFRPAQRDGVAVYLRTNGLHAEIVVPAREPFDWTQEFPPESIVDPARVPPAEPHRWLAFGWGDRDFLLNTPTWGDLRARTAWVALYGSGRGAVHVEYLVRPEDYESVRVVVSGEQYLALAGYLSATLRRDAQQRPIRIDAPGYFATDAFFEAIPAYDAFFTCNEWVRRGLAAAGVRTAVWAPFDGALFYQLRKALPGAPPAR
jgi:uncharacterized protein (TIGR02117 family)